MIISSRSKALVHALLPPLVWQAATRWRRSWQAEKEQLQYVPSGWQEKILYPGWNTQSVLEAYKSTWPRLVEQSKMSVPFSHILGTDDLTMHNILLCFAYSLALSAQAKASLSMLDWGGAIGQYRMLARAALPDVALDYACVEVPLLVEHGQKLHPDARFLTESNLTDQRYDFVLASSSLQYCQEWQEPLNVLARATCGYFLLTRMPVNNEGTSYVFSQRAYGSAWLAWSLSRVDLLNCAKTVGLDLVREFTLSDQDIPIKNAPFVSRQCGFLFRAAASRQNVIS